MKLKKKAPGRRTKARRTFKAKTATRKRRASNPPKKRVYRRKRASNPPGGAMSILGAALGGLGSALAGNLIAAAATKSPAIARAIRIAVPVAVGMVAGRRTGAMADAVEKGAYGAAGVELLDLVAANVVQRAAIPPATAAMVAQAQQKNPPISILRYSNPPPIRFANPGGGIHSYPATVSGQLPPAFISPLRFVEGNPYA